VGWVGGGFISWPLFVLTVDGGPAGRPWMVVRSD
jgi:hypothetical protein